MALEGSGRHPCGSWLYIRFEGGVRGSVVSDGVGRRAGVFWGLASDEVLRLRRTCEERVGAMGVVRGRVIGGWRAASRSFWDTCEHAHRAPGLPGGLEASRDQGRP